MLHSVGLLFDLEEPRVERLYGTKQWQRNQNEKIYDENILCDKMQIIYQKSRIGHLDNSYNITRIKYSFDTVAQKLPTSPMKHFVCVVP